MVYICIFLILFFLGGRGYHSEMVSVLDPHFFNMPLGSGTGT